MKSVLSIVTAALLLATVSASASTSVSAAAPSRSSQCPQAALVSQAAPRHPDHPRSDAVLACVGRQPITGAQFARWAPAYAASDSKPDSSRLVVEVMRQLLEFEHVKGEARARDVVVTARAVDALVDRRFRRVGSRQRFLRASKVSAAELRTFARHSLRLRALRRVGVRFGSERFEQRWRARTTCALAYADSVSCGLIASDGASPPAVGLGGSATAIAVDPRSGTVYLTDSVGGLTLIDGTTCNASMTAGCTQIVRTGPDPLGVATLVEPSGIAIDETTGTIYIANRVAGSVVVLDTRTCNATNVTGCRPAAIVRLGQDALPGAPTFDPTTRTVYVPESGRGRVAVLDARACNATDTSGCAKSPARVKTGSDPGTVAADSATHTVYVPNGADGTLSLIEARTCNGADTSGCGTKPATVKVGPSPRGVAVDADTGTAYLTRGDSTTVSVIDTRTCNATAAGGCQLRRFRSGGQGEIAFDPLTRTAYLTDYYGDAVTLLDTAACNATVREGCKRKPRRVRTGILPVGLALDRHTRTLYVASLGSVSLIRADACNAATGAGC